MFSLGVDDHDTHVVQVDFKRWNFDDALSVVTEAIDALGAIRDQLAGLHPAAEYAPTRSTPSTSEWTRTASDSSSRARRDGHERHRVRTYAYLGGRLADLAPSLVRSVVHGWAS